MYNRGITHKGATKCGKQSYPTVLEHCVTKGGIYGNMCTRATALKPTGNAKDVVLPILSELNGK